MEWLTPAEIRSLVQRSFDEKRPLDHILSERLFGSIRAKPRYERDWPPQAKAAYYAAVNLWIDVHRADPTNPRQREQNPPSIHDAYRALRETAEDPAEWWLQPHVTWKQLGAALGVDARTASYHLCDVYGFRFAGRYSRRHVQCAPCIACGEPTAPHMLSDDYRCPPCWLVDRSARLT